MKEILTEICDLNKRGDFKGCYQLKTEYLNASRSSAVMSIAPSMTRQVPPDPNRNQGNYEQMHQHNIEYEMSDEDEEEEDMEMEDVTPY